MTTERRKRKRKRHNRSRFGLLYSFLSLLIILAVLFAGCIIFFRVNTITVEGSTIYSDEQIIAASGIEEGNNLFLIQPGKASQSVISELPYIREASVNLSFPNKVRIEVTADTTAATLQSANESWWAIDLNGKLLAQGDESVSEGSPLVTGLTPLIPSVGSEVSVSLEDTAKLSSLLEILESLNYWEISDQVQSIDMSSASQITMEFQDRFIVLLPVQSDDFHTLIHSLKAISEYLDDNLNDSQSGTIDLSGEVHSFIPAS